MLFSIILTNYNYSKFLYEAIDSVINQTYQNFELIIVDDGSDDNSREIIFNFALKYKEKIKVIMKNNEGQAAAFNDAYKLSKGDIIVFLDADDYFYPNKLKVLKDYFENGHDYILNNFDILKECSNNQIVYYPAYYPYEGYNLFLIYYLQIYTGHTTSNIAISKKLAEKIFPIVFEKEYKICADDYIVYAASILTTPKYIQEKLSVYRLHGKNRFMCSVQKNIKKYEKKILTSKVIKKFLKKLAISSSFFGNPYHLYLEFKTHSYLDESIKLTYKYILDNFLNVPEDEKRRIKTLIENYYKNHKNLFEKDKKTILDFFVEGLNASENL